MKTRNVWEFWLVYAIGTGRTGSIGSGTNTAGKDVAG